MLDAETGKRARPAAGQGLTCFPRRRSRATWSSSACSTARWRRAISTAADLLWEFQTEASKRNDGWVLTADRKFNAPMLFPSNWREAPIVATIQQFGVGSIFSSPLVVGGVVYFGSTDGYLYAVD